MTTDGISGSVFFGATAARCFHRRIGNTVGRPLRPTPGEVSVPRCLFDLSSKTFVTRSLAERSG